MSKNLFIQIMVLSVVILVGQIFIPAFSFNNLIIIPDILIIYLTYLGFYHGRFYAIILGFIFGITQDFITQMELLGAMAFTKSALGFGLGTLALYRNIWPKHMRLLFIFLMYLLHFFIYFFIKFNGVDIAIPVYMQVIVIHSLLSFTILFIIDKSFMKHGVIAK